LQNFLPLQAVDGRGNLAQRHLGDVAGGASKDSDCFGRVKKCDRGEIFAGKILACIHAAAGQKHIGNTVYKERFERIFHFLSAHCLQYTAFADRKQIGAVITEIVLCNILCCRCQTGGEIRPLRQSTIAVFKAFKHRPFILGPHPPDGNRAPCIAVGVEHIKDVTQSVRRVILIHQQRYPLCTPIYITSIPVPETDFSAGCGVRLLRVDQKLLPKAVLEIVGGCG